MATVSEIGEMTIADRAIAKSRRRWPLLRGSGCTPCAKNAVRVQRGDVRGTRCLPPSLFEPNAIMPTPPPTRTHSMERDRIPELDLLRFIAAVSVVLFHATNWPADPNLLTRIATYGSLGVPLFFMISGFVILMTAQNRSGIEFINSRIARLYPSFWIAVLLSSLALALLADDPPSLATFAANLTMQPHAFD